MERFLTDEMEVIADLHRLPDSDLRKYSIFHTILNNDFNKIPEGFTAVFLRGTPVQIIPDECIVSVKILSSRGFLHENSESRLVCFCNANTEEGDKLFRAIMECVVQWMDKNL